MASPVMGSTSFNSMILLIFPPLWKMGVPGSIQGRRWTRRSVRAFLLDHGSLAAKKSAIKKRRASCVQGVRGMTGGASKEDAQHNKGCFAAWGSPKCGERAQPFAGDQRSPAG